MNYIDIIQSIVVLAIIIGIGFTLEKLKIINRDGSNLISNLIMKCTLPMTIISSMQQEFSQELLRTSISLILLSIIIYVILIFIVKILDKTLKLPKDKFRTIQFLMIFGNVTFMGFPVISAIYGDLGIFYASCFNLIYHILMFSYGLMIFDNGDGKFQLKKLFNPGLIATLIGFVFFSTSIKLPYILFRPMQWVGDMTIPLALIVVGCSLARMKFKEIVNEKIIWGYAIERLLIFPVILLVVLKFFGVTDHLLVVPVVILATPAPLTSSVLAKLYGGNEEIANKSILLTNFLAIITVPMIILLT